MPSLYTVHGLVVESAISLHGFLSHAEKGEVDFSIETGTCLPRNGCDTANDYFEFGQKKSFLYWTRVGAFCLLEGRTIIVQPHPGVAEHLLRPFLVAAAIPVLLYQRGLLVLHASAVALREEEKTSGAVAFLGKSGQGKSTMATALAKSGHNPLSDDVIATSSISQISGGKADEKIPAFIHPGPPHLKLRVPSLMAFEEDIESLSLWSDADSSRVLRLSHNSPPHPFPLRSFYVLEDGDAMRADLLSTEDAFMCLLENSYGARLFNGRDTEQSFLQCSYIAQQLPVFRLQRPRDFRYLPNVVHFIEEHQKSLRSNC